MVKILESLKRWGDARRFEFTKENCSGCWARRFEFRKENRSGCWARLEGLIEGLESLIIGSRIFQS